MNLGFTKKILQYSLLYRTFVFTLSSGNTDRLCISDVIVSVCVLQRAFHTSMPFTVFCLSGLSAGCLGLLLPETLNGPSAETLEELSSSNHSRVLESKVTQH